MADFIPKNYWEQRLERTFDLHGVGYLGLGRSFNEWMYRLRARVFDAAARRAGFEGGDALDVGSGTGFYIERWRALGAARVMGIDLTDVAVRKLAEKFPFAQFNQGDIGDTAFVPPGAFDAVSCMDVLFHIVDDARFETALGNIYKSLKPGGVFIYSDNFVHGPAVRAEHQVSRSLSEVEAALRRAGFRIEDRRPMFVLMNGPVDARGGLYPAIWNQITMRLTRRPRLANLAGPLYYLADRLLVDLLRESPTTEIMICRR